MRTVLALSALLVACSGQVTTPELASETSADLHVYPASAALREHALVAADRLLSATGLGIVVDETPSLDSVALFWSDMPEGQWGYRTLRMLEINPEAPPLALENVILHETVHALGVGHLREDGRLMSERLGEDGAERLTAEDLELICTMRDCTAFNPEGGAL